MTARTLLTGVNVVGGASPVQPDCTVVIEGNRITSVSADPVAAADGDQVIDLAGRTVMPGMALCHFHSTYADLGTAPYGLEHAPSYQALVSHKNLMTALTHGYTTIVGAGASRDIEPGIRDAIEAGVVPGPRLVPSGRELSTTGHANEQVSLPWHWNLPELGAARSCDGPEGFRYTVRDEIHKGVEVIKLFVTGGHGVPGAKDRMEMTRDELAAAIDTAHSRGALARAHLVGKKPIMTALELGIDIVDHGDEIDDEVIAALAETGAFLVPSVLYPMAIAAMLEPAKPRAAQEIRQIIASVLQALPKAQAAGVKILLGDDYGGPGLDHGEYGKELHAYVDDAGLPPLTVIGWATRNAAALLGREHDLGTVETGKLADLLVLERDPTADITAIADEKPVAVLRDGKVVAGTLEKA